MTRPLIVALHGVGSSARQLASALAPLENVADVLALDGGEPFDGGGGGRQWFSISEVTEADRPARVLAALPSLLARLDAVAAARGIDRSDMVLLGFSQGAIMTLAAIAQGDHSGPAVAIAGRLAAPVKPARDKTASLLLVHDRDDAVMPVALSDEAGATLAAAGHRVATAHSAGVGHGIGPATVAAIADWLATNVHFHPLAHLEG
jgi:phospholipase/carboxylesterase